MKNTHSKYLIPSAAALVLAAVTSTASAATILIDEDWTNGAVSNDTRLDGTTTTEYPGWDFSGSSNTFKIRNNSAGSPSSEGNMLQFEWTGNNATYDTGHTWGSTDAFSLSFNASEQSWTAATSDRWFYVALQDVGTTEILWEQFAQVPEWADGSATNFTAGETFGFTIDASTFTTGSSGNEVRFLVGQLADSLANAADSDGDGFSSNRGLFVDNIALSVDVIPEPATTALFGLSAIAFVFRRRR